MALYDCKAENQLQSVNLMDALCRITYHPSLPDVTLGVRFDGHKYIKLNAPPSTANFSKIMVDGSNMNSIAIYPSNLPYIINLSSYPGLSGILNVRYYMNSTGSNLDINNGTTPLMELYD